MLDEGLIGLIGQDGSQSDAQAHANQPILLSWIFPLARLPACLPACPPLARPPLLAPTL